MNRLVISPETLEKIKELKKLFGIRKNTTFIEKLVDEAFRNQKAYKNNKNRLNNNPFGVSAADLINKDRFGLEDNLIGDFKNHFNKEGDYIGNGIIKTGFDDNLINNK